MTKTNETNVDFDALQKDLMEGFNWTVGRARNQYEDKDKRVVAWAAVAELAQALTAVDAHKRDGKTVHTLGDLRSKG